MLSVRSDSVRGSENTSSSNVANNIRNRKALKGYVVEMQNKPLATSRYATREEALSEHFMVLNREIDLISNKYSLSDFADINRERYPWAECLHRPEFYASRLWEYPWAALESSVMPGMCCADIGCGESPFTIYLKTCLDCEVIGFDPDYGTPPGYYCYGVSEEFAKRTGIDFVRNSIHQLDWPDDSFDRVFCISVIEHIPSRKVRNQGMREIARILKPGGLAAVSVDINLKKRMVNPLELIWESGLALYETIDLTMPRERFGIFADGKQPADVFGFILRKPDELIKEEYRDNAPLTEAWHVSYLRDTFPPQWPELPGVPDAFRSLLGLQRSTIGRSLSPVTLLRMTTRSLLKRYPKSKS